MGKRENEVDFPESHLPHSMYSTWLNAGHIQEREGTDDRTLPLLDMARKTADLPEAIPQHPCLKHTINFEGNALCVHE